ncbi:glycine--tRNA ligase, partial [human gut metagenome]
MGEFKLLVHAAGQVDHIAVDHGANAAHALNVTGTFQFFCQPGTEMKWFEYWKKVRLAWHEALGMGNENYRYHDHEKLAHYANAATDIEFKMP